MSLAECSKFVRFFSHTAVSAAPLNGSSQISHYSVLVRNRKRKNSGHAAFPVSQTHAFSHLFSRTRPFGAQTRFHRCWQCARKPGILAMSEFFLFRSVLRYIRFLLTPDARHAETAFVIWSSRIRLRESWKVPDEAKAAV